MCRGPQMMPSHAARRPQVWDPWLKC